MKRKLSISFLAVLILAACKEDKPKTKVCERCRYTYDVLKHVTDDPFRRSKFTDTVEVLEILNGFVLYIDYPYYQIKRSESIEYFQSKTTLIPQEKITRENISKIRNF